MVVGNAMSFLESLQRFPRSESGATAMRCGIGNGGSRISLSEKAEFHVLRAYSESRNREMFRLEEQKER
jgi:hypothetical protein